MKLQTCGSLSYNRKEGGRSEGQNGKGQLGPGDLERKGRTPGAAVGLWSSGPTLDSGMEKAKTMETVLTFGGEVGRHVDFINLLGVVLFVAPLALAGGCPPACLFLQ